MIYTLSIDKCNKNMYDDIYLIVRSIKKLKNENNPILLYSKQILELSPSENLFIKYNKWISNNKWNYYTFNKYYKLQFLSELISNEKSIEFLKFLKKESKTKNIALLCYCKNKNLCHRSLIGKILQKANCNIIID